MTIALLDGDIFAYRTAATAEQEEFWIAKARVNEMLERCLSAVKAESYQLWLSGDPAENFRYKIYPEYKANRTQPRPRHLEPLREYLVSTWGARLTYGYEADDALGINATDDCIICSIDKDLLQISGNHWNFVKDTHTIVSEREGINRFYRQMLQGDTSDNIKGVPGIGRVKSERLLPDYLHERDQFNIVRSKFGNDARFIQTGDLVYILRSEGERWSTMKKDWFENSERKGQGQIPGEVA